MKRIAIATIALTAFAGLAAAQTADTPVPGKDAQTAEVTDLRSGQVTLVYDQALSKEFEVSREIIERIKAEFGESAVYDNGQDLPEDLDGVLQPGGMLPADTDIAEVPEQLGDLPTLGEGTRWVAVGEHLVEVGPDNTIVMVVYDALP